MHINDEEALFGFESSEGAQDGFFDLQKGVNINIEILEKFVDNLSQKQAAASASSTLGTDHILVLNDLYQKLKFYDMLKEKSLHPNSYDLPPYLQTFLDTLSKTNF